VPATIIHCSHRETSVLLRTTPPLGGQALCTRFTSHGSGEVSYMLCGVAVSVWSKQLTTLGAWLLVDGTRSLRNGGVQVRCVDGFGYCESKSEYKPHVSMGMPLAILYSSKARPGVSLTAISTSFREDSPGFERNAWMIMSRNPRSVWKVDS
jgi:hypothetical protein